MLPVEEWMNLQRFLYFLLLWKQATRNTGQFYTIVKPWNITFSQVAFEFNLKRYCKYHLFLFALNSENVAPFQNSEHQSTNEAIV